MFKAKGDSANDECNPDKPLPLYQARVAAAFRKRMWQTCAALQGCAPQSDFHKHFQQVVRRQNKTNQGSNTHYVELSLAPQNPTGTLDRGHPTRRLWVRYLDSRTRHSETQGVGTIIFTTGKPRPGYVCRPLWVRYPSRTAGLFWYRVVSASLGFDTRKLPRVSESVHLGVSESVLENMNPGYHSRLTLQAMTGPAGRYFEPYRCHSESMFGIYVRRLVDSM
jgi:hypothetical protein